MTDANSQLTSLKPQEAAFAISIKLIIFLWARNIKYTVSQKKNCANFFLSEFRQISTNFGNVSQKHSEEAKIIRGALIFHLN